MSSSRLRTNSLSFKSHTHEEKHDSRYDLDRQSDLELSCFIDELASVSYPVGDEAGEERERESSDQSLERSTRLSRKQRRIEKIEDEMYSQAKEDHHLSPP